MGHLEVITGPMFSGKTDELLRRLRRLQIAKKSIVLIRPSIDTRHDQENVYSHSGAKMPCVIAKNSGEVFDIAKSYDAIGIDEIQFFNDDIVEAVLFVASDSIVITSGLDTNFRFEPFGVTPLLMAYAEKVDKLTSVCASCGGDGTKTQRLINGKPAPFSGPEYMIGGLETYEARCRSCFQVA